VVRAGADFLRAAALGQDGAADRAFAAFDAALEAEPANAHARAGRGLALVSQALTAPMSRKLALATEGCAELDAAVAAAPADPAIRLMRASNAVLMPVALDRQAVAESDFTQLLAWARDNRVAMALETRRGIFLQAAAFALKERRTGAVELLEEALTVPATEPTDEQVQSMLALARRQAKTSPSHADSHPPEKASSSGP
jgi:tetratricopeptide (TPR) repeat protein